MNADEETKKEQGAKGQKGAARERSIRKKDVRDVARNHVPRAGTLPFPPQLPSPGSAYIPQGQLYIKQTPTSKPFIRELTAHIGSPIAMIEYE
jgi:hypothetical protein